MHRPPPPPEGPALAEAAPAEPEAARAETAEPEATRAETAEPETARGREASEAERRLSQVLERVAMPARARATNDAPVLRIGRVVAWQGRSAHVSWRDGAEPLEARLADEVEGELIARVVDERGLVLVEQSDELRVVGVLQTRERAPPRAAPDEASLRGRAVRLESEGELSIKAERIEIEGASEVLLRVGPVALRLRRNGTVELVGSNVYLTSRGVFRLIGRVLRLN